MKTKNIIITLFLSIVFASCSNKTDVMFMGMNIKSPCESFIRHLEKSGFHKDGDTYKGKYLGEYVFVHLGDEINGHYKTVLVTALFAKTNESNYALGKQYFKKVCREVKKEHSGFEEEEDNNNETLSKEFYGESDGTIKITFAGEELAGMVVTIYDTGEK